MPEETQTIHFSVEADYFEKHARDLLLEQNWRGALSFLMTTLQGMTLDIAVAILKGEMSLSVDADGDLQTGPQDLHDPHFVQWKHTYEWQHAGLWQIEAEFYQPYAMVQDFGHDDLAWALEQMALREDDMFTPGEFRLLRARYHAQHRESDFVHFTREGTAVLFQRVPGPAFWQAVHGNAEDALAAFRRVRRLEAIGTRTRGLKKTDCHRGPLHWSFYVPALRQLQLCLSRWDESLLSGATRDVLARLVALQDNILSAEAAPKGDDDTERFDSLRDEFESEVNRIKIREQAEKVGGFITLVMDVAGEAKPVQVPATPLLRWAARNLRGFQWEDVPPWECIYSSGAKALGDDPMHTDWWVGAGFEPRHGYNYEHPLNKAAWAFSVGLSESYGCDFVKLAGKGRVLGRVVFPAPNEAVPPGSIAVVPYAGVDYEMALFSACKEGRGAVISAVGGKLAHLATVARETEGRIVVVNDAMNVFKPGELVTLDLEKGTLTRHVTITGEEWLEDDSTQD